MALVAVVMGSKSDTEMAQDTLDTLSKLGISYEVLVASAHRQPEKVREFATQAEAKGFEVIIALAGYAAHLPGVIASWTTLPVIGVPLPTSDLKGLDSLLASVQMPSGIPVAVVTIGGAKNAAFLAAEILGIKHEEIKKAYKEYRESLRKG